MQWMGRRNGFVTDVVLSFKVDIVGKMLAVFRVIGWIALEDLDNDFCSGHRDGIQIRTWCVDLKDILGRRGQLSSSKLSVILFINLALTRQVVVFKVFRTLTQGLLRVRDFAGVLRTCLRHILACP